MPLLKTNNKRIILASQSPRRIDLLKKIINDFEVKISNVDENNHHSEPNKFAIDNSEQKALKIAQEIDNGIIIGADSIVVLKDKILGKPKDKDEAMYMLNLLSNEIHQVFTGFTVIEKPTNKMISNIEITKVKFRCLDSWEIDRYIEEEPPFDKAGSYGIQDGSAVFVEWIHGCYFNVVGLPLSRLYNVLCPFLNP